jgi:Fe-Mn family superoxide dismutase
MNFYDSYLDISRLASKSMEEQDFESGYDLPKLPYSFEALEPIIDATTMRVHHGKHHKKYVEKMNEILDKKPKLKEKSLIDLLIDPKVNKADAESFLNNAGGHFNHSYFWITMSPTMNQKPSGKLAEDINKQFGSFDNFKKEFIDTGVKHFGSGWVWLCTDNGKMKVQGFLNQSNPYIEKCGHPLLGCDVWEHAYYLKYQNNREKYLTNWFKVINWDFISKRYEGLDK